MAITHYATAWNTNGTYSANTVYKDVTGIAVGTGDLVIAYGANEWGSNTTPAITTQAGSTSGWTTIYNGLDTSHCGFNSAWATASASGTLTVRVTVSANGSGAAQMGAGVWVIPAAEWTGTPAAAASGPTTTGLQSLTVPATASVVYFGADWDAAATGSAVTPSGGTIDSNANTGNYDVISAHWTGQAAGTRNYGPSSPSGATWLQMAVAIEEAGGAPTPVPRGALVRPSAASVRAAVW